MCIKVGTSGPQSTHALRRNKRHGRANARATETDAGDPALLGRPQAGELRLQRCDACKNVYFPPRPFCPSCASRKVSVFKATGKGKLYSYVIHHRPVPGFAALAIAVVELDEGPRMMTNIVDCPQTPEALELDMKVEVASKARRQDRPSLFRPAKG